VGIQGLCDPIGWNGAISVERHNLAQRMNASVSPSRRGEALRNLSRDSLNRREENILHGRQTAALPLKAVVGGTVIAQDDLQPAH